MNTITIGKKTTPIGSSYETRVIQLPDNDLAGINLAPGQRACKWEMSRILFIITIPWPVEVVNNNGTMEVYRLGVSQRKGAPYIIQ